MADYCAGNYNCPISFSCDHFLLCQRYCILEGLHTGRDLSAGPGTTAIYLSLVASVFTRLAAGAWPQFAVGLHQLSGLLWLAAFAGVVAIYGPMLMRPRAGS